MGHSVRTAVKKLFFTFDTTNWSHKLYTITEINYDT